MDSRLPTILLLLLLAFGNTATAALQSAEECLRQSDELAQNRSKNTDAGQHRLQQLKALDEICPELPQLKHNLGVLHARHQDWDQAIAYLQESLAMDTRASHTAGMLEQIHRYHAVQAYREALQSNNPPPSPPALEFQTSDLANFSVETQIPEQDSTDQLHTLLQRWWDFSSGVNDTCEHCFAEDAALQMQVITADMIDAESLPHAAIMTSDNNRVVILQTAKKQVFSLHIKPYTSASGVLRWQIDQLQVLP